MAVDGSGCASEMHPRMRVSRSVDQSINRSISRKCITFFIAKAWKSAYASFDTLTPVIPACTHARTHARTHASTEAHTHGTNAGLRSLASLEEQSHSAQSCGAYESWRVGQDHPGGACSGRVRPLQVPTLAPTTNAALRALCTCCSRLSVAFARAHTACCA